MTRNILQALSLAGLFLLAFCFVSCGENLYDSSSIPKMNQYVYMVPDGYSGNIYESNLRPIEGASIDSGKSVKFVAVHTINGIQMYNEDAAQVYKSLLWEIDGEYFNLDAFRYTFKKNGLIQGKLITIDVFDDTLVSNFSVRVNTPEKFSLNFPYDGYNQAEPSKNEPFSFHWTISGIDDWESATCDLFISTDKNFVWTHFVSSQNCNTSANFMGPLIGDSTTLLHSGIDLQNESLTFYWGVKYTIYTDGELHSENYSPIYRFSTKYLNNNQSTLRIPIEYKGLPYKSKPINTFVHVVSATGDTLETYADDFSNKPFSCNLPPQKGVKVYFEEKSKAEYIADSIQVDLYPGSITVTDTVYFIDNTPPQIEPFQETSIYPAFLIYDDGSGLDPASILIAVDNVKVSYFANGLVFSIDQPFCQKLCTISVSGSDYAGNKLPEIYWNISVSENGNYTMRRAK